jgi:collagen type III alpha
MEQFVDAVIEVIRGALAPLTARLVALEQRQVRDGQDGAAGAPGAPGRDGRDGQPGRDGAPGAPGEKGLDGRDGKDGRDGVDGKDGADGFGFDDLDMTFDGQRTFTLRFVKGDRVKEFSFTPAIPLYAGVFDETKAYEPGDSVTYAGSTWIAREQTTGVKPDEHVADGKRAWTLSVKRGRDGKDGRHGEKGDPGPEGRPGRDLTQLGPDGRRW